MFETCLKVKNIMNKFGFPWFIAGGWAIDLFLNRETRLHEDIEIGIYRKNQMQLYRFFEKYKKYYRAPRKTNIICLSFFKKIYFLKILQNTVKN